MCLTALYTIMTHPTHINALLHPYSFKFFPIMHPPMNTPITPSCPSPPQEATFWQKDGGLDFAEYTMASSKSSQPLFTPVSDITNLFPRPSHLAMMQYCDHQHSVGFAHTHTHRHTPAHVTTLLYTLDRLGNGRPAIRSSWALGMERVLPWHTAHPGCVSPCLCNTKARIGLVSASIGVDTATLT